MNRHALYLVAAQLDAVDAHAALTSAAHAGAYGANNIPEPTQAQAAAGNYKLGRTTVQGLRIAIEQPQGSIRRGVSGDGKEWACRMAAHYGYFEGTKGADGDGVDCFIGPFPESKTAYVINQNNKGGGFDETKVMVGFVDEQHARAAYLASYERGWSGLKSIVPLSISQLRWWLKHGKTRVAFTYDQLPQDGNQTMNKVEWNREQPKGMTIDKVLYEARRLDGADGLLLDSVSMAEIMEDSDGVIALDALVVEYAQMGRTAERLRVIMDRSGGEVKAPAVQVSEPFKARGVTNIAAVYELSDGQTVSIFFHNPDTTPNKLTTGDELISWKWLLNKKDITIVVAPEKGQDLNPRTVAQRIMKLAEKNSAAFQKANVKRAERLGAIQESRDRIAEKEATLSEKLAQLEAAKLVQTQKVGEQDAANATTREKVKQWLASAGYAVKDSVMGQFTKTIGERMLFVTAAKSQLTALLVDTTKLGTTALNPSAPDFHDALIPTSDGKLQPAILYGVGFEGVKGFVEAREGEAEPVEGQEDFTEALAYLTEKLGAPKDSGDGIKMYQASGSFGFVQVVFHEKLGSFALNYSKSQSGAYGVGSESRTASTTEEVKAFVDRLMPATGSEDEPSPIALVDAAYQFANATDAFKERVAFSIDKTDYSEFASAKAMDMKAKELGAEIHWGLGATLDGVDNEDDFDPEAEFDACPVVDQDEDATLDGDFKGHPFRGNQYKKASSHSHAAVKASISAKHAEKDGDAKGSKTAHKSAHYSHMAAAESTSGKARRYHRKMAKFHGSRSGMALDGVEGWDDIEGSGYALDDAADFKDSIVGKIMQGGKQKGRAVIGGDGKAMVFVGKSNDKRVQYWSKFSNSMENVMWSEDDGAHMVELLLVPEKPPVVENKNPRSGTAEEQAKANAAMDMAVAVAVDELGGTYSADGHSGKGTAGAWTYGNARVNGVDIRLGASGGGVVQINGKPHDPNGEVITTPEQVKAAILAVAPVADVTKDDEAEATALRQMDDELTYARQGTYSPEYLVSKREASLSTYFGAHPDAQQAHEAALAEALALTQAQVQPVQGFRYALVNRPAMVGGLPSDLKYTVQDRPSDGQPHYDMARHGILVAERELTADELKRFELARLVDADGVDAFAQDVVDSLGEYAGRYAEAFTDSPELLTDKVRTYAKNDKDGVMNSLSDVDSVVTRVLDLIQKQPEVPTVTPDPTSHANNADDRAFLMSVIDGTNPEMLEPELATKIEAAYQRNSAEAEMVSLFTQAVNAYTAAMMAATVGV